METFFIEANANVLMTIVICLTILIIAIILLFVLSRWHKEEIGAELEKANKIAEQAEKERQEKNRKEEEEKKAKANTPSLTPEEEVLKKELQRKERVLSLLKDLCALTKGREDRFSKSDVDDLFELYKKIDEYDKTGK